MHLPMYIIYQIKGQKLSITIVVLILLFGTKEIYNKVGSMSSLQKSHSNVLKFHATHFAHH